MSSSGGLRGIDFGLAGLLCLALALLYVLTGAGLSTSSKSVQLNQLSLYPNTYGPFTIQRKSQPVEFSIHVNQSQQSWTAIDSELIDKPGGSAITGFSGDLWRESGRDSDGAWSDEQTEATMRLTLSGPREYYLRLKVRQGAITDVGNGRDATLSAPISIRLDYLRGSSASYDKGALLLLILGLVLDRIWRRNIKRAASASAGKRVSPWERS
ncbi:hypothetical protein [Magnetofaba australis]|uniref:Uncharacterized protein n=1 Tax=Magnetofaba australis IT-1 TaxID=1434232 RepID=A0A1Y2K8Y9_9PROT|nr:hypothetical protein [Magnetofaba australis]OSM07142.1 hypothetical protein MAIT1_03943 [Magnetofaba australis IT-1]